MDHIALLRSAADALEKMLEKVPLCPDGIPSHMWYGDHLAAKYLAGMKALEEIRRALDESS